MYQAIFDTDFDKYCEDASFIFGQTGIQSAFEALEGWPADYATNPSSIVKFFREHQWPSLLEYSEHPYVSRRNQESAQAQSSILNDARPDAVTKGTSCLKTRHPEHPGARASTHGHAPCSALACAKREEINPGRLPTKAAISGLVTPRFGSWITSVSAPAFWARPQWLGRVFPRNPSTPAGKGPLTLGVADFVSHQ